MAPPGRGEQGLTPAPTNTLETVANLEGRSNENGVRLPRDYATTQVLQTPNAISVHNTAVISHPTPKGHPGTNSYQSMTIVHPNSVEEDRRTVAAEAERVKHIFPGTYRSLIKHDRSFINHHLNFYHFMPTV